MFPLYMCEYSANTRSHHVAFALQRIVYNLKMLSQSRAVTSRDIDTTTVSGLWNIKVAGGKRTCKVVVLIKHLRFIFVCLVNLYLLVEETMIWSTEKIVWSIFHCQASNRAVLFFFFCFSSSPNPVRPEQRAGNKKSQWVKICIRSERNPWCWPHLCLS